MVSFIRNRTNTCKHIIICLILLCATDMLSKRSTSLGERQEVAKREGTQSINLMENERNNLPDLYTQTQAHAQIKKMRELIQENFKNQVVPHFDIISRMVTKEAELKDTHYVFYQTTATMLTVITDVFTQLYFNAHPNEKGTDDATFRFLRFQGQSTNSTAAQFLEDEMRGSGLVDDKLQRIMAILLSVNLSLFGSTGSKTESTYLRFLDNRRSVEPWQKDELNTMMDHFGVTKKYVEDIMKLNELFTVTPEGALVQMFVPKNIVDNIVYLAWIRGIPASGPIMEWIKAYQQSPGVARAENRGGLEHIQESREKLMEIFTTQQDNPMFKAFMDDLKSGKFSTYAYLKAYCNKPAEVPYLNDTQGRMIFTKEGLLNPESGIKIYYYFGTPREKIAEYTNKLNEIVGKIIAEKQSNAPAPTQKKSALAAAAK